jgi:hypothetical protein
LGHFRCVLVFCPKGVVFFLKYIFDFEHIFPSEADAGKMLEECRELGYKEKVSESYDEGIWECQINIKRLCNDEFYIAVIFR